MSGEEAPPTATSSEAMATSTTSVGGDRLELNNAEESKAEATAGEETDTNNDNNADDGVEDADFDGLLAEQE